MEPFKYMLGKWVYGYAVPLDLIRFLKTGVGQMLCIVGSGLGETAILAHGKTKVAIHGFEIYPLLVDRANEKVRRKRLADKIKFYPLTCLSQLFHQTYDAILFEAILSFSDGSEELFSKALKRLKIGGRLGLVEPVWVREPTSDIKHLFAYLFETNGLPKNVYEWKNIFYRNSLRMVRCEFRRMGVMRKFWEDLSASPSTTFSNLLKTVYSIFTSVQNRRILNDFISFYKYFGSFLSIGCYVAEKVA